MRRPRLGRASSHALLMLPHLSTCFHFFATLLAITSVVAWFRRRTYGTHVILPSRYISQLCMHRHVFAPRRYSCWFVLPAVPSLWRLRGSCRGVYFLLITSRSPRLPLSERGGLQTNDTSKTHRTYWRVTADAVHAARGGSYRCHHHNVCGRHDEHSAGGTARRRRQACFTRATRMRHMACVNARAVARRVTSLPTASLTILPAACPRRYRLTGAFSSAYSYLA